jgi:glycosyltransferase involved in cell wall biosynthesis
MHTLTLISDTLKPCGVEGFARGLAGHLARHGGAARHDTCAITGQPGEILVLRRALATKDTLIVNLPIVAWKQRIAAPARAMVAARRLGKSVILVLHEWGDLDWKRRATYLAYLPLASRILFSSPFVRAQFEADAASRFGTSQRGLVPIPPILACPTVLPATAVAAQIAALKASGKRVLGHFGAIYPKKQSTEILEIAARLKANGQPTHCVFIGDFIGGATVDAKAQFQGRIQSLGLEADVLITGYIGPSSDVFAAIEACDVMVYLLAEGLTSRRSSVLACLQSSRPLFVNGPSQDGEFAHHPAFSKALAEGHLVLLPRAAKADAFAIAIAGHGMVAAALPRLDFNRAWDDVVDAVVGRAGVNASHTSPASAAARH